MDLVSSSKMESAGHHDHRGKITCIGIFTSLMVGCLFLLVGTDLIQPSVVVKSVLLGGFLQLFIYTTEDRLKSLAAALLLSFLLICSISFLPFAPAIATMIAMICLWQFRQVTFSSLKFQVFQRSTLAVGALSLLYALTIFEGTSTIDFFTDEKIRQFALNPDSLFHVAMSTLYKNYGIVGTGLNGLPTVHYHFFSHILYASASKLLAIEPFQAYGYSHWISFAPLLVTTLLRTVCLAASDLKWNFSLSQLIVLGGPFSLLFEFQWNSHWVSESYLIGLILLAAALSFFLELQNHPPRYMTSVLVVLIPMATVAKISVGTVVVSLSLLFALTDHRAKVFKRAITGLIFLGVYAGGFIVAKIKPIPRLEAKWQWGWFRDHLMRDTAFPIFLAKMFPLLVLLIPFILLARHRAHSLSLSGPLARHSLWTVGLAGVSLIGFLALNLTIDSSGYYFSNIYAFVALPVLALFMNDAWLKHSEVYYRPNIAKSYVYVALLALVAASVHFFFKVVPASYAAVITVRGQVRDHRGYVNEYIDKLQEIAKDPDHRTMVYIPKTEIQFWENFDDAYTPSARFQCIRMPFYIPILSGKPAVLGLPDPKRNCYTFHRGYEVYSEQEYAASTILNATDAQLCDAVQAHGFRSVYRVTRSNPNQKLTCTDDRS